ncbi:MAG: S-methyl-5-thioribose-1-phosphate isomerase [Myxococcales bacterium]|nr:S-methyl-5-thioribose-1-phosphate isomerase [Myxococcales bacterium]
MTQAAFRTLAYEPGRLTLLDQTRLPREETYVDLTHLEEVARAIETMVVRGAPAIGIAAAYGIAVAAREGLDLAEADRRLRRTRPTAVNLFWALDRMQRRWHAGADTAALEAEGHAIYAEEVEASRKMGEHGAALIPDRATILTHCNAGALATAELGTALAVIRAAHAQGKHIKVVADETRPVLQGARLTAWELMRDGIDVTLIADGAVAHLASRGEITCAVTGADRIAANGDAANKIGTHGVACILNAYGRPFYVAAPWSTVDERLASGADIEIEERSAEEVTTVFGVRVAPEGVKVRNPAFDVTPAKWIHRIITERGAVPPGELISGG